MSEVVYPALPILMVDDEERMLNSFRRVLHYGGINNLIQCQDSRKVMDILAEQDVEAILLDLLMPNLSGDELLPMIAENYPGIPIIIITGVREIETAVNCMRLNAYDYLVKPVDEGRLLTAVNRAIEFREMQTELFSLQNKIFSDALQWPQHFKNIITHNKKMRSIFQYIEAVSISSQPVLITGETGVGKEMIAEAIHHCSGRTGRFIRVSVAGLDENMFSDTLFGHIKGAFTSADQDRKGLVEKAYDGTLFLDEIGDLALSSQVKLLRLIQEREYFPLGADEARRSRTRILAATNQNLEKFVTEGRFRNDLFYRLNSHHVNVPPLRERLDDLYLLVDHFFMQAAEELKKDKLTPTEGLISLLSCYDFPGNIRELKAIIFDATAKHTSKKLNIKVFDQILKNKTPQKPSPSFAPVMIQGNSFSHSQKLPTARQALVMLITEALKRTNGNKTVAAQMLGITRQTIVKYMKENAIE